MTPTSFHRAPRAPHNNLGLFGMAAGGSGFDPPVWFGEKKPTIEEILARPYPPPKPDSDPSDE